MLAPGAGPERPPADDAEPARAVQLVARERDGMVVVREEVDRNEAGARLKVASRLPEDHRMGTIVSRLHARRRRAGVELLVLMLALSRR